MKPKLMLLAALLLIIYEKLLPHSFVFNICRAINEHGHRADHQFLT